MSKLTEKCPYCNGDFVKVSSHLRHCKQNPINIQSIPEEATEQPENENIQEPQKPFFSIFKKEKTESKPPTKFLTMEEKMKAKEAIDDLSPEEKFLNFFSESPLWIMEKPKLSFIGKIKRMLSNSEVSYKQCVFVSENSDPKYGYFPYDSKDKYLFLPDGKIYDLPQSGEIWFFNADRFLPLIHSRKLSDIYDLPIHHATAIHNDGVLFGKSVGFADLIDSINSIAIISKISAAVAIIAIVGAALYVKQVSGDYSTLATEIHSLTNLIQGAVV